MVLVCDTSSYHDAHLCQLKKIPPCMTKLLAGHEQVSLKNMHKVKERTVTLTFNLAAWFLSATHRLITIIICAKLFLNPTMHDKVMGRT